MKNKTSNLSCVVFQAQLPELISSGVNLADHSHLRYCFACRRLLADLEIIAEAAHQLFSIENPPQHLWREIQFAIQAEQRN